MSWRFLFFNPHPLSISTKKVILQKKKDVFVFTLNSFVFKLEKTGNRMLG